MDEADGGYPPRIIEIEPKPTAPPPGLKMVRPEGPWGGVVYGYRGAEVWTDAAGTRWQVWIEDHPLRGVTLRCLERAIEIVDAWAEGRRLPPP